MLVVISSGIFLNLKNFTIPFGSGITVTNSIKTNPNLRNTPEVAEAAEFIKANIEPGDIIVSEQPHLLTFYLGKIVDYFFEGTFLIPVVIYPRGPDRTDLIFLDRIVGTPAILSVNEFKRIIGAGQRRVWLIATPDLGFDKETQEFINRNKKVLFERYKTKVYLIGGG